MHRVAVVQHLRRSSVRAAVGGRALRSGRRSSAAVGSEVERQGGGGIRALRPASRSTTARC